MRNLQTIFLALALLLGASQAAQAQQLTATWALSQGAESPTQAALSSDNILSSTGLNIGSDLSVVAAQSSGGVSFYRVQPATSNVSEDRDEDAVTFILVPKKGISFQLTHFSMKSARFGTNGGRVDVVAKVGDTDVEVAKDVYPARNSNDPATGFTLTDTGITAPATSQPVYIKLYVRGLGNTKQVGFADVVVTGNYSGTAIDVPSYTLTTALTPNEAGQITVTPTAEKYDEGTEITVSASENFGFHFHHWADENGQEVSTSNPYTFAISKNTTLQAVYTAKQVYALNIATTSGAHAHSVTIEPEGNVVNGVHHYEEGTQVKLTATNNKLFTFTNWADDNTTQPERIIQMTSDTTLTANYSATDYIVGWDLYDMKRSDAAADYAANSENAGLLVLRNAAGTTTSWLASVMNGRYSARVWKNLKEQNYFEISFSTTGYKNVKVSAAVGDDYNGHSINNMQVSLDGTNYTTVGTFNLPNRGWDEEEFALPDSCSNQTKVWVRFMPDWSSPMAGVASDLDGTAVADIYVLADNNLEDDHTAPVLLYSLPANQASGASSVGSIILAFNEKVTTGTGSAKLNGQEVEPTVSGKTVTYKYSGLAYSSQNTFSVPAGAITDIAGNAFEGCDITFKVMERTQPEARLYDAVVAQDASGDYTSLQAAIDAAPANRVKPWLIFVKKGTYTGHVTIPANKPYLYIIGQGKDEVSVSDDRTSGSGQYGINDGATMDIEAGNIYMEGIDLINAWGVRQNNGPQALALASNGDRLVMNKMKLRSYQDTWYTGGSDNHRSWLTNSVLEGAVDFVYGKGDVLIENNTVNIVRKSGGYIVAPNHGKAAQWGYVFLNNTVTAPGVPSETDVWLGRPWHEYPKTVYINTRFEVTIPATGWFNHMGGLPALWAEYNSMDGNGNPLDLSNRNDTYWYMNGTDTIWGKSRETVLTDQEAAAYTRDNILQGSDQWNPTVLTEACAAPNPTLTGSKLSWPAVPYAMCYVVMEGDSVIGFTTSTTFDVPSATATYAVMAANEYGGLSAKGKATVGTGISTLPQTTRQVVEKHYYSIDGKQLSNPAKGFCITRTIYTDGTESVEKSLR